MKLHSLSVFRAAWMVAGCCWLLAFPALAQQLDMKKLSGLQTRSIGPAGMSGRVTAFDVVHANPKVIYAGTASGGLWKSESGGMAWKPIFDTLKVASIGDVAVDQTNPNVIWVGTGEGNPRNSQTSGNGVYKSMDGGRTWKHLGLDNTRNIHRIAIHAQNPDIVYVGVQGTAWADSPDRGVYRTTDGGKTWEKVLYVDEKTGIADMVVDPQNPNKIMAAMWEFRRWPWFFKSGGKGSGIYVSFDAGKTWEKRTGKDGLPAGELGRIGLAIAPSNPNITYAWVESAVNGVYRSEDGGFTWKKTSTDKDPLIGNRPFYYADIYVDTKNENRLYSLATYVTVSEDGGKTFKQFMDRAQIHVDNHAWWSHPDDPNFLLLGNDGGMAISRDRGQTWYFPETLPLAQFYHINVDMETPYNVYGGLQDNGSWSGPSQVWRETGIRNAHWVGVGGGDGFDVVPDPVDARYGYAMSQGGSLMRYDTKTGSSARMKPVHPDGTHLRFNWNAGIAVDPIDKKTVYYGSQFLLKSADQGKSWSVISPDLTTNDSGKQKQVETGGLNIDNSTAENHTTIITVAPSAKQAGVIWVGTDDGNVQLTQDGGTTWTNLTSRIKGVPANTWVTQIQASTYNAGEAFVVFDNHRHNDWTPYIYHTRNFGKTWERLVDDKKVWGYALAVVQDPVAPKLLFCGTEFGLYVSVDAGATWTKWTNGFPTVSTMDLVIHPREHDLVIATFGRAVYVLDDIRPLREMAQQGAATVMNKPLHVFQAPETYQAAIGGEIGYNSVGHGLFVGENRPFGALVSYSIKDVAKRKKSDSTETQPFADSVRIDVLDKTNALVRTLYKTPKAGVNRIVWELNRNEVRGPNEAKPKKPTPDKGGFAVLPGTYTVRVRYNGQEASTPIIVRPDPRVDVTEAEMIAKDEMIRRHLKNVSAVTAAIDQLTEAKDAIKLLRDQLQDKKDESTKAIITQGKTLEKSIQSLIETVNPKEVQGFSRDPALLSSKLAMVNMYLQSPMVPVTRNLELAMSHAEQSIKAPMDKINAFFQKDWANYKNAVENANFSIIKTYSLTE